MVLWRVRDFHDDDLDAAIRLWGDSAAGGEAPVFGLSDLVTAVRAGEPAVVAVVGDQLAGTAAATVSGGRASGGWWRSACTASTVCWRPATRSARWPWSTAATGPGPAWSSTRS